KEKLYDNMGLFSNKSATFSKLSDIEKFQECYKVLGGKRFSAGDIHDLFNELLVAQPKPRPEDVCMAEMIYAGYFEVVITTTIDPSLQDALYHQKALFFGQQEAPFVNILNKLLILHVNPMEDIIRDERRASKTIKI